MTQAPRCCGQEGFGPNTKFEFEISNEGFFWGFFFTEPGPKWPTFHRPLHNAYQKQQLEATVHYVPTPFLPSAYPYKDVRLLFGLNWFTKAVFQVLEGILLRP